MFIPARAPFLAASPIILPEPNRAAGVIPGAWLVAGGAIGLVVLVVLMASARLTIDPAPASVTFFTLFGLAALVMRCALRDAASERARIARDASEYFGLFVAFALIGAIACYPIAADSRGFADPELQRADALLHFHWPVWYGMVAAHPLLQWLGAIAYQSIFVTPAVLLGYFAIHARRAEAHAFLAAFWLAAVLALALFALLPAVGPLALEWRGPLPYLPESGLYEAQLIPLLRLHLVHSIDLGHLRGLVSAPSFHTASAVLLIATAWPFRVLRWPVAMINAAMLLATPVEGTHYLSDMILGAAVAGVALAAIAGLRARLAGASTIR